MSVFRLIGRPDGFVTIEYADYAAARHFLTQIEEWYEALEFSREMKWFQIVQSLSHWFRQLIPVSFFVAVMFAYGANLSSGLNSDSKFASGIVMSISYLAVAGALSWMLGGILGRLVEYAVDRVQPVSYVLLNRGDEKIRDKWRTSNVLNSFIALAGVAVSVTINITSSWLFEKFF